LARQKSFLMRRLPFLVSSFVGLFVLALPVMPAVAATPPIPCGSVLKKSVVLYADMSCTTDAALDVGAPNITINLNGHSVTDTSGLGIRDIGFAGVAVTNGSVTASDGVYAVQANKLHLKSLRLGGNGAAVVVKQSNNAVIEYLRITGPTVFGVELSDGSTYARIANIVQVDTQPNRGIGISLDAPGNVVSQAQLSGDNFGVAVGQDADHSLLEHVTATLNNIGILVDSSFATVRGAQLKSNGVGIDDEGTNGVLIANSTMLSNARDGVFESGTTHTTLRGNLAHGNGQDGFNLAFSTSDLLASNAGTDNGRYGINASSTDVDGGGNTAKGNAGGQCIGPIVCG
jgi:large repetitive protein